MSWKKPIALDVKYVTTPQGFRPTPDLRLSPYPASHPKACKLLQIGWQFWGTRNPITGQMVVAIVSPHSRRVIGQQVALMNCRWHYEPSPMQRFVLNEIAENLAIRFMDAWQARQGIKVRS